MLSLLVPLLAVVAAAAAPERLSFDEFCEAFGKKYTGEEYATRRALYEERVAQHAVLNARPGATWTAGPGPMTDLHEEEMRRYFGYAGRLEMDVGVEAMAKSGDDLPQSVDWRSHTPSIVPPVRSQGGCGSCWAFSAVATIESVVAQATGTMLSLSPQQITSCTPNPQKCGGSGGCTGATAQLAYNYTIAKGIADLGAAPYSSGTTGRSGRCLPSYKPAAGITGYVQLPLNEAPPLLRAVATQGLVSVSVDASHWFNYESGVFDGCAKKISTPNHAVTLVGYGVDAGVKYWLIQNSWGTGFGEEGYIRLRRYDEEPCSLDTDPQQNSGCEGGPPVVTVCGECGVLSDSSYPTGAFIAPSGRGRLLSDGFFV